MEKTLRLLMLLAGIRNYSVQEITENFSIDERTVYRYFNKIENAGFALDKNHGRYQVITQF